MLLFGDPLNRALCSNTYPDVVCRSNYSFTAYNPPLLYDLHTDPSEIYNLDTTEYADILAEIAKVTLFLQWLIHFVGSYGCCLPHPAGVQPFHEFYGGMATMANKIACCSWHSASISLRFDTIYWYHRYSNFTTVYSEYIKVLYPTACPILLPKLWYKGWLERVITSLHNFFLDSKQRLCSEHSLLKAL